MCGRFTLFAPYEEIIDRFDVSAAFEADAYTPSYNIAPSQSVVAIISDGKQNRMGHLRWGLIPPFAKDEKIGYKMINARAETVAEKPSFKRAFKRKRCILPADSFYEWQKNEHGKTPMRIRLKNDGLFAIAGLWEAWQSPEGKTIYTCTAITTEPNELMAPIHNRMPVILRKEDEAAYLNPNLRDAEAVQRLLRPYDAHEMEAYAVSDAVNSPKNNEAALIARIC